MKNIVYLFGLIIFFGSACADFDFENEEEVVSQTFEARRAGRWIAPQDIIDKASRFNNGYVGAGAWRGTSGCGGSFSEGAKFLKSWVQDSYPQVTTIGGYACRQIRGGSSMSVHATGRAIDIHFPLDSGQADNGLGDPLANYFLEHAEEMGVQLIIWDRTIWSSSRTGSGRFREYTGQHPHHDHIHLELTPEAARKGTPWFSNPTNPGSTTAACAEITPAGGGIVDNTSQCFKLYGDERFWRTENEGFSGSLRWTNAFKSDGPANWAEWNLNLARAGKYRLSYYSVPEFAVFNSTRYSVTHGVTSSEVFVDQSAGGEAGWKELGIFEFQAGPGQSVAVFDDSPSNVGANQHIIADAILIEPVDQTPHAIGCGMVFKGGGTIGNQSDCFESFGEERFWRQQRGGFSGTFYWTNAFSSDKPSNWAKWNINLEEGGFYDVYYYSVPNFAKFNATRYEIKHSTETFVEVVDLSADGTEGWKKIGTYSFDSGPDQWVAVYDNSPGRVGVNQSIIVDSIRLLPFGTSSKIDDDIIDIDDDVFEDEEIEDSDKLDSEDSTELRPKNPQNQAETADDVSVESGCSIGASSGQSPLFFLVLFGLFFTYRRK